MTTTNELEEAVAELYLAIRETTGKLPVCERMLHARKALDREMQRHPEGMRFDD